MSRIDRAVNESIERFMIEEGLWSGLKNFVYDYMDAKTNGEWNTKYGMYSNHGNLGSGERGTWWQRYKIYTVLINWMKYHRQKLYNLWKIDSMKNKNRYDNGISYNNNSNRNANAVTEGLTERNKNRKTLNNLYNKNNYKQNLTNGVAQQNAANSRNNNSNSETSPYDYARQYINSNNFKEYARRFFDGYDFYSAGDPIAKYFEDIDKYAKGGSITILLRRLTYSYFYNNYVKNVNGKDRAVFR